MLNVNAGSVADAGILNEPPNATMYGLRRGSSVSSIAKKPSATDRLGFGCTTPRMLSGGRLKVNSGEATRYVGSSAPSTVRRCVPSAMKLPRLVAHARSLASVFPSPPTVEQSPFSDGRNSRVPALIVQLRLATPTTSFGGVPCCAKVPNRNRTLLSPSPQLAAPSSRNGLTDVGTA